MLGLGLSCECEREPVCGHVHQHIEAGSRGCVEVLEAEVRTRGVVGHGDDAGLDE